MISGAFLRAFRGPRFRSRKRIGFIIPGISETDASGALSAAVILGNTG